MALYVRVGTSHDEITTLRVSRRGSDHGTEPDSIHSYGVHRQLHGREQSLGEVEHRYGDGADKLAMLALGLAVMTDV